MAYYSKRPSYSSYLRPRISYSAYSPKRLGEGAASIEGVSWPSYPSYLGVPMFDIDNNALPEGLFGFTDGKSIALRSRPKISDDPEKSRVLKLFVQLHEEEHVKDMSADELTVDRRAFDRLLASRKVENGEKLEDVLELLAKRWPGNEGFREKARSAFR